jgi:uncharacterized protein YceH (UPF0502 family)
MLPQNLNPIQARVLGSLIEKELSTPEHYPLSLNALTNACNQSSNRDPVMKLDEGIVSGALDSLRRLNLVRSFQASGSRVPKYQHLLTESGELAGAELAVICALLLRGPQTAAELKTRSARLTPGDESWSVEQVLNALAAREPQPAVIRLQRRPGQKEARFMHLLGDAVTGDETVNEAEPTGAVDRLTALEEMTRELRDEVTSLRAQFAEFRKQLE